MKTFTKTEINDMVAWLEQHPEKIPEINAHIRNSMSPDEQRAADTQVLIDQTVQRALLVQKHPQLESVLFPDIVDAEKQKLKTGIERLNIPEMCINSDDNQSFSIYKQ